jgi:hypothetical protein
VLRDSAVLQQILEHEGEMCPGGVEWKYGLLDGDPFMWRPGEAWVLTEGSWRPANSSEIGMDGRVMSKDAWDAKFPSMLDKATQEFVDNLRRNSLLDALDDPVSNWLRRNGHPITRENWIALAHLGSEIPDPWTAEHEDELPEVLQRWPLTPPISN